MELRLPWLLLNVADPTDTRIHQDYYTNYGVISTPITTFYIGLGDGKSEIALSAIDTKRWDWELSWRERLKRSYFVVQSHWNVP